MRFGPIIPKIPANTVRSLTRLASLALSYPHRKTLPAAGDFLGGSKLGTFDALRSYSVASYPTRPIGRRLTITLYPLWVKVNLTDTFRLGSQAALICNILVRPLSVTYRTFAISPPHSHYLDRSTFLATDRASRPASDLRQRHG